MSDKTIQELLDEIRGEIPRLFRVCESIAMLDMIASFAQLVVSQSISTTVYLCDIALSGLSIMPETDPGTDKQRRLL